MKSVIGAIVVSLFCITANSFAHEAKVYFADEYTFSIDGYDFFKNSESLPIISGKSYDVAEEGEILLAGESFKKLVRITDLETGNSEIFTTRVINNSKKAIVKEAIETSRIVKEFYAVYDENGGSWFDSLNLSYDIILEDGELIKFNSEVIESEWARPKTINPKLQILPGDQIEIFSERSSTHFTATYFGIKVTRDEELIGIFNSVNSNIAPRTRQSIIGTQRQDNSHGTNENIYVINTSDQNSFYGDAIVTFQNIEGIWKMFHWEKWNNPPYPGQQYQFIKQIDTGKILLRLPLSNYDIEFARES
jgi:hypothetical protein